MSGTPETSDANLREYLYRSADEAIFFKREFPQRFNGTAKSVFGGQPRLPAEMPWPKSPHSGRSMTFIAQIDLASLPDFQLRKLLPRDGTLVFFSAITWDEKGSEPSGAVLYAPAEADTVAERPIPSDLMPL